jgi:NAD(P)-dependent dehydrogenase (short-subunit alcohol dehydrogenase family)
VVAAVAGNDAPQFSQARSAAAPFAPGATSGSTSAAGRGRVINLSSQLARKDGPTMAHYCAAKAGAFQTRTPSRAI